MNTVFIPKDNPELPDSYSITIDYLTGGSERFDCASYQYIKDLNILELVLKEDIWVVIPFSSIKKFSFDKRFSKLMAIFQEKQKVSQAKMNEELSSDSCPV